MSSLVLKKVMYICGIKLQEYKWDVFIYKLLCHLCKCETDFLLIYLYLANLLHKGSKNH